MSCREELSLRCLHATIGLSYIAGYAAGVLARIVHRGSAPRPMYHAYFGEAGAVLGCSLFAAACIGRAVARHLRRPRW